MIVQVTKPAQSLAPMVVVWALARAGYTSEPSEVHGRGIAAVPASPELQQAAFHVLYGVPALCAIVQLAMWSCHHLRGSGPAASAKSAPEDSESLSAQHLD